MARILAIDYGVKKTGLAVTDPLQLIGSPLQTIETSQLFEFLLAYAKENELETIIVGEPFHHDGQPAQLHATIVAFANELKKKLPNIGVVFQDERGTSKAAQNIILQSGKKKMARRDKTLIDKVSANIILHSFMVETGKWQTY